MTDADQVWALLADIELLIQLRQESLEQKFITTFEQARDRNRQLIHVAKTSKFELELRPPGAQVDAMLVVRFAPPLQVGTGAVHERFPADIRCRRRRPGGARPTPRGLMLPNARGARSGSRSSRATA